MLAPELEEFSKLVIQCIRDSAIASCDSQLRLESNSPLAKRWKRAVETGDSSLHQSLVADFVDETVFYLLNAIDEKKVELHFRSSSGKLIELSEEGHGELGGWYMASGGWRAQYSRERFFDDFADLAGPKEGSE